MHPKKRLTEAQWSATVAGMDLNPAHRQISHDVMVRLRRQIDVCAARDLTPGAVSQVVNRVWRAHQARIAALPEGWRQITVILPEREAALVEAMARLAKQAAPR